MYLEENKELADGMNHLEIRLGTTGMYRWTAPGTASRSAPPFPVCTSSGGGRGCCA